MKPPIYNGLIKYISKQRIQFTSPGHKGKVRMRVDSLCRLDVANPAETDDFHNPNSFITESENQIAGIFGTDKSFYLTSGAASGIYASLASVCNAGDKIIVDPECDKSVINAITILALIPVFLKRNHNRKYDISGGIDTEELEYLTEQHRDAKVMLITSPTYYGVCANIRKAAEIAHGKKMLLMVDESLGAHFNFCSEFPDTALECGADVVIQSCSETLGGFSGSGLIHISRNAIAEDTIREQLAIYQGGSDSFASLCATENAIGYVFKNNKKYASLLKELERGKHIINHNTDIMWFDAEYNNGAGIDRLDPLRVVLNFSKVDISATDAAKILVGKYGIEPETADRNNLVFTVSIYNTPTEVRRLVNSCVAIGKLACPKIALEEDELVPHRRKVVKVLPYKAFNCEGEKVHYMDSEGRLCRRLIYKCPHGTPIIIPGEKITAEHIAHIGEIIRHGGALSGVDDSHQLEVLSLGDSFKF